MNETFNVLFVKFIEKDTNKNYLLRQNLFDTTFI